MPASGLLISWATTAASLPSEAIFSTTTIWRCVCSSCRVFSCDPLLERAVQALEVSAGTAEIARHLVPGAGELAHLVPRAHRDAHREVALPGALHGEPQPLDRPQDEGPQQHEAQQEHREAGGEEPVLHLPLGGAEGGVGLRHREPHVEDPEDALRGGVHVARRALGLVVDGGDDAEDARPPPGPWSIRIRSARSRPAFGCAPAWQAMHSSERLSTRVPSSAGTEETRTRPSLL